MSFWTVDICDSSWNSQGILDAWDSLSFTKRYCDIGTGSLNTTASVYHRELIQIGSRVIIREDGVVRQCGLLKFGESFADSIVMQLAWVDEMQLIADRVAYGDPSHDLSAQETAYHEVAGQLSSVLFAYIVLNCGVYALPERRIGLIGDDPKVGPILNAAVQARFDNLLELCKKIAIPYNMAFQIGTDDRQHYLGIYQCRDLSADVTFSDVMKTMGAADWAIDPPEATRLIGAGPGEGLDRMLLEITTGEGLAQEAAWGRRIEQFYDNGSAKNVDQLADEGYRQLATKGETLTAKFQPAAGTDWKVGRDYRLGDRVGCELRPGWILKKPIIEVNTKVNASGSVVVTPLAGDPQATSGLRQDIPVNELRRDMSALQRNK